MKKYILIWANSFFTKMSLFYAPIEFLFYQSRGLSIFQVGLLFSFSSIVTIVTDIPFGLLADKKSKKLSATIGLVSAIIGTVGLIFSQSFLQFAFATMFLAIGDAGTSGSVEILLMNELEEENQYYNISAYAGHWANLIGGVTIGTLYALWEVLPFILSVMFLLISLSIVIQVKELSKSNDSTIEKVVIESKKKEGLKQKWLAYFKNNSYILFLLFLSYLLVPQLSVYLPVYLEFIELNVSLFGFVYMVASLISILGTRFYKKYLNNTDSFRLILFSYFILFLSTLVMSYTGNPYMGLLSYFVTRFVYGWFWIIFRVHINDHSTEEDKATIFGVREFVMNSAFFISDPLMSYIITSADIQYNYFVTSILLLVIILIMISVNGVKIIQQKLNY